MQFKLFSRILTISIYVKVYFKSLQEREIRPAGKYHLVFFKSMFMNWPDMGLCLKIK